MDDITLRWANCKKRYDGGGSPSDELREVIVRCLRKLSSDATAREQGALFSAAPQRAKPPQIVEGEVAEVITPDKGYSVYSAGSTISRPFLPAMFLSDADEFARRWDELIATADTAGEWAGVVPDKIDVVLYTAINAFALCYGVWKPDSRKTPGTFWEVLLGTLLAKLLPAWRRGKSIMLPDGLGRIATDISFTNADSTQGLVFPAKITTRERIVQPFAHQWLLGRVFPGRYRSVLLCVSELQRAQGGGVNEICVPGPLRLYQKHLPELAGIYYLDPPSRYLRPDVTEAIPVGTVGQFLTGVLPTLVQPVEQPLPPSASVGKSPVRRPKAP